MERNFLSPSKLKAAIIYMFMILIAPSFIGALIGLWIAPSFGVDGNLVASSFFEKVEDSSIELARATAFGYGSFISYLIAILLIGFYMRNYIIEDFLKLKNNKKIYLLIILGMAILFAGFAYLLDFIFSQFVDSSNNQKTIIQILNSSARIPMIIVTVLLAPIVEELIFRKAIFESLRKFSIIPCYVVSILLFAIPHMLSTNVSVGVWLLQLLPYMILGGMLAFIYHISNHNVYASALAHAFNNILSVILVFV